MSRTKNEREAQHARRLHDIATIAGSLAPSGSYGLPSAALKARTRATRRALPRGAKIAIAAYWCLLPLLAALGILAFAISSPTLGLVAALVFLLIGVAAPFFGAITSARAPHVAEPTEPRRAG